jgi:hypothetical protein
MTTPTWGLLHKSQVDSETVEAAIARLIQAHDDDETAHLEVGQSLQSHKASEIIDHAALSIINDKVAKEEIRPDQISVKEQFFLFGVQSIDGWTKTLSGTGAVIQLDNYDRVSIETGSAVGNKTILSLVVEQKGVQEADPCVFEFKGEDVGGEGQADIAVGLGIDDPFSHTVVGVGFEYREADAKLYAFVNSRSGGVVTHYEEQITGSYFEQKRYRIQNFPDENIVRFYENGVEEWSYDYTGKDIFLAADSVISFGVKRYGTGDTAIFAFWQLYFVLDL